MDNVISVAQEFSDAPGPRYARQGDSSGEEFYAQLLYPGFVSALDHSTVLVILLDGGVEGYSTGFLDETFGKLSRVFGPSIVRRTLNLVTSDSTLLDDISDYIDTGVEMTEPDNIGHRLRIG
jgi:hypothetical protein